MMLKLLVKINRNKPFLIKEITSLIHTQNLNSYSHITHNKKESLPMIVTGFSRFASRKDVLKIFKEFIPSHLDPILDGNYLPSGDYLFKLPVGYSLELFRSHINKSYLNQHAVSIADNASRYIAASSMKVSHCTVRCKVLNTKTDLDDLHWIFEDSGLRNNGITKITGINHVNNIYLVHFASPQEAERAVTEKSCELVRGEKLELHWYQC